MSDERTKEPKIRFKGYTGEWEEGKLEKLASFTKGNGYSKSDLTDSGTPIILYGRLYTKYETVITNVDTFATAKENSVKSSGGEVIVPASGESAEDIARASVVNMKNVLLGGDLNIIKPYNEIASVFLALTISNGNQQKELSKRAQGKSVVHIRNNDLKNVNLTFPKLEEQQKIGSFFQQLDDTIALHQRELDLLKQTKQTYLQKMFPKADEDRPEIRFAGFTEAWEERKLGDIVKKAVDNRGKTPPTQKEGRHPLLEVASLGNATPDYKKVSKYVDEDTFKNWFRDHIKENDILFSTVGNTGLVSLMDAYYGVTIAQNIVAFRAKSGNNPKFLVQMFQLSENFKRAKRIEMGAVQPSIKVSQLIHVSYFLPKSEQEQQKIGSFFKQLDDTITLHQRKLDSLKEMKKSLLQQMFV